MSTELLTAQLSGWSLQATETGQAGLRSGLIPLHPALGAPDVRQALIAQQRLHSSIFGSSAAGRWRTEDSNVTRNRGAAWHGDMSMLQAYHTVPAGKPLPSSWKVPTPDETTLCVYQSWAPGSTHVAAAFAPTPPARGGSVKLLVVRVADHASR